MLLVGLLGRDGIPSPPILAGRANKAHSRSLGGGLPVSAEFAERHQVASGGG